MPEIDYVLHADGETPERLMGLLTEQIWRIGPSFVAFRPDADRLPPAGTPALVIEKTKGWVTLGSFVHPAKISDGFKGYAARVPLGRVGNPVEAAQAALWLCSSAASYVTGESMIVDGGLTCWAR